MDQIAAMTQMQNNQYQNMMAMQGMYRPSPGMGMGMGMGCCPQPWGGYPTWNGNMPDSQVGRGGWLFQDKGYAVDQNGNGRYDRGKDAVIAFDLNRDGKVDTHEMEESNQRLKAFGGNYDMNGDGKVNFCERIKGHSYQCQMQGMDHDRDGRLNTHELAQGGGRVMVDQSRDGHFQPWEQYSPYRFPTPGFGTGSIGYVDPRFNHTQVNQQPHFRQPWAY